MTPFDTSRSLTRRVPIYDSPRVVEYHGPVNSTKLLISRSVSVLNIRRLAFAQGCRNLSSTNKFQQDWKLGKKKLADLKMYSAVI